MTREGGPTLASSSTQLLELTERAEQWRELLEEPSAMEILGDLLLNEVLEDRLHEGAALGWLLGACRTVLDGESPGDDPIFGDEPFL